MAEAFEPEYLAALAARAIAASRIAADEAVARAIAEGATLEGLQDALTRRLAASRLDGHREALDRAYNPALEESGQMCGRCFEETSSLVVHSCTTEQP